jgi:3,4-dihydroxy 2-butanone 4-phosphate synthase/GTP cyclohydrolase II
MMGSRFDRTRRDFQITSGITRRCFSLPLPPLATQPHGCILEPKERNAMLARKHVAACRTETRDPRYRNALRGGGLVLILGHDRDGTECAVLAGDARTITAAAVNRMTQLGRGVVACAVRADWADRIGLELIPPSRLGQIAYCRSVEASSGVTTGISAADRALTLNTLASRFAGPASLVSPGHIMPNIADLALDPDGALPDAVLARIALIDDSPAAVWCFVLNDAGFVASHRQARHIVHAVAMPVLEAEPRPC